MQKLAYIRKHVNAATLRVALRRWLRPAALLLVVLCIAVAEPLVCIMHCQLAMSAQPHQQQHHDHSAMVRAQAAAASAHSQAGGEIIEPQTSPGVHTPWCFANFNPSDSAPNQFVPSSPIHEVVLAAALSLLHFMLITQIVIRPFARHCDSRATPPTSPPRHPIFA